MKLIELGQLNLIKYSLNEIDTLMKWFFLMLFELKTKTFNWKINDPSALKINDSLDLLNFRH